MKKRILFYSREPEIIVKEGYIRLNDTELEDFELEIILDETVPAEKCEICYVEQFYIKVED